MSLRQPKIIPPARCFWCLQRTGTTKDHVISRPLASVQYNYVNRYFYVPACFDCNQKRAFISNLFKQRPFVAYGVANGAPWGNDRLMRWLEQRAKALPWMLEFRQYYLERLTDALLEACMYELREVGCPEME